MLINLHAEQFLYPLLATSCLWLFGRSLRPFDAQRTRDVEAILAGIGLFVGLWFSFSLLALLPAAPLMAWCSRRESGSSRAARSLGLAA